MLALGCVAGARGAELVADEALGVRVAPGFRVTLYADQDLANDIQAMTLDARGRVVVTGPGYIKRLEGTNAARADRAVLIVTTRTGGMGLCFDGDDLLFFGDGSLRRFHLDAEGRAITNATETLLVSGYGEHGTHAMRKGPDGFWYLIGGNDAGFGVKNVTSARSPVQRPEAGCVLRFTPDFKSSEVIAHGLRNPYDYDFNSDGELFTYDSDVEREFLLPWYTPTRLYHLAYGGHHGWRLSGYLRSHMRRAYYADSVEMLAPIGRGSPTGVTCYRHNQFPEKYRGGFFALDWTFGKIWFTPLLPRGAGYDAVSEVFLEPLGSHGFAPTDCAVAPDGSLFVCIGGRKTRGAVYRIEFVRDDAPKTPPTNSIALARPLNPREQLRSVLDAPQPLDAWSRAQWMPLAQQLGGAVFKSAVLDATLGESERVRAAEILVELFGGIDDATAVNGVRDKSPRVRARMAWALGRDARPDSPRLLAALALDDAPVVRRCAIEALLAETIDAPTALSLLPANLAHDDARVRLAAVQLAVRLPAATWQVLWETRSRFGAPAQLSLAHAAILRAPEKAVHVEAAEAVLSLFEQAMASDLRLHAARLMFRALGDYNLHKPSLEIYTEYEFPDATAVPAALAARVEARARGMFPAADGQLRAEASRLLAALHAGDPKLLDDVMAQITPASSATDDLHFLIVLSRLPAARTGDLTRKTAAAVLNLDAKLGGMHLRTKQTWGDRLGELVGELLRRDPALADALLGHVEFATADHVDLVKHLDADHRARAAVLFLVAVKRDANFVWSPALVQLLRGVRSGDTKALFRAQWANRGLRDALLPALAENPEPADRGVFIEALELPAFDSALRAVRALAQLPVDADAKNLLPVMRVLERSFADVKQPALRQAAVELIARQGGEKFAIKESAKDAAGLRREFAAVFEWFTRTQPALAKALASDGEDDPAEWGRVLKTVAWEQGDVRRGEVMFRERACQSCHAAAGSLGPDLTGAAKRFSVEDLFAAIVFPSRDIAPPYRPENFLLKDGSSVNGLVVFVSADGWIVQTGASTTVRLDSKDVVSRQPGNISLMPAGLLKGAKAADLADLFAYLKSLGAGR
jgi:putative heme-binding domain-containing protein